MEYEPELGQRCFGQPSQSYQVPNHLLAAIKYIKEELERVMWNKNQDPTYSPFESVADKFVCPIFDVEAYSWDEEYEQPWNFRYNTLEVSWYKHLGRGMSMSRSYFSPMDSAVMLDECLDYLNKIDKETMESRRG
jgi:hypothetical protein